MDLFSTRELAFFLWGFLLLGYCLFKRDIRQSLWGVVKAFFQWRILLYVSLSAAYFFSVLFGLNFLFPLTEPLLKDAVLWFLFSGLIATARSIGTKDADLLQDHFFDNFKFTVVFEFVIATYVFPLPFELAIIPLVTLIALMETFTKTKLEFAKVKKLMTFLLQATGVGLLTFSIYSAVLDYDNLLGIASVKGFLLPFLLMVFYFPLTYAWVLKATYDRLFIPVRVVFANVKKEKVGRYLRFHLFIHCWFSRKKLESILGNRFGFWHNIESKDDVKKFMSCVKTNGYFGERYEME